MAGYIGSKAVNLSTTGADINGDANIDGTLTSDGLTVDGAATITVTDNSDTLTLVSTDADATVGPVLNLFRNSASPADNDVLGRIVFKGEDSAGNDATFARIEAIATDVTNGSEDGRIDFFAAKDDSFSAALSIAGQNVGIGTSSPVSKLHIDESAAAGTGILLTNDNNTSGTYSDIKWQYTPSDPSYGSGIRFKQLDTTHGGQLEFFTDNTSGTYTQRMTITEDGNVGIGNSTPSNNHANANNLVVGNGTAGGIANYVGTGLGWYAFSRANANNSDAYDGGISYDGSRNLMFHTNAGSERMRIDSSGNLLVGTTTTANLIGGTGNDGVALTPNHIEVGRSGGAGLFINRYTSDGDIAEFRKDGTTVGSIGASGGEPYIGNGDTGLKFNSANDYIQPFNVSGGSGRDNAIDIGNSGNRFKDLYLSGGVYLGGTGSANKLDDYEEGTWTPTLNFGGNATGMAFTTQSGSYVRVGQVVTAQFRIELSAKGSSTGNANFGGLPFNATSVGTLYPAFYGLHHDVNSGSGGSTANVLPIGQITRGGNSWNYYNADSTTAIDAAYFNNNTVINGTVTFRVN
jgi:hypothetical protein